ncbi:MAG: serine hydrolase domain-containing protein [Candidatus Eisenbacteria bacterium]
MPTPDVAATKLTDAGFAEELGGMLDRVCGMGLFSGAVIVARGNDVIFERACGEADRSSHEPIDMDTKFNVGSMNKMFTAVAAAQLVEQGKLSYDAPLSEFLDESWLPMRVSGRVTIHQLLTHTSGLGDFLNATFEEGSGQRFRAVGDYRELVARDSPRFEPGTDWSYSSTGFILLGAVIESVTGGDYFDYMREYVYGPAGMGDTDCYDMDSPVENMAVGYSPSADSDTGWEENRHEHFIRGGPAGGGFSTAPDLFRFTKALASGALVSGESVQRMWTDYQEGDGSYGYGFMLRQSPKGLVVGHDGGFTGMEAYYDVYLQTGHTVVVLTNLDGAAWPVDARIRDLMERLE